MKIIGLTGGIGSGKSVAAHYLGELGAAVMDLDKIGHDVLLKGGGAYRQVVSAFGKDILAAGDEINRARLGKIVFNDAEALKKLDGIVHPAIDKVAGEKVEEFKKQGFMVVVMEAAVMLEAHKTRQADEVWVVTAPEAAVLKRLKARNGYTKTEAETRIHSQLTTKEKIKQADVVISNNGTLEELKEKVKAEWDKLQKRL